MKRSGTETEGQFNTTLSKQLSEQCELKVRTPSLKLALCTCYQTPAHLCIVYRTFDTESLRYSTTLNLSSSPVEQVDDTYFTWSL